jgi:hypothetical protein
MNAALSLHRSRRPEPSNVAAWLLAVVAMVFLYGGLVLEFSSR